MVTQVPEPQKPLSHYQDLCEQLTLRPVGTTAAQMREAAIVIRSLEIKADKLRAALLTAVETIRIWHNMDLRNPETASALWDTYWRHSPEMRVIREALSQ